MNKSIYRKAAEIVVKKEIAYACIAIDYVVNRHLSLRRKLFELIFGPKNDNDLGPYYVASYDWFGWNEIKENQLARSLALLFMEQIAKDELKQSKKRKTK